MNSGSSRGVDPETLCALVPSTTRIKSGKTILYIYIFIFLYFVIYYIYLFYLILFYFIKLIFKKN